MSALRSSVRWAVPLVAGLLVLGCDDPPAAPNPSGSRKAAPHASSRDDFNGDGYQDLAIGAARATVGGQGGAGYAAVLYGGPHGLSAARRTVISRATGGVPGDPVGDEGFGTQLTKGDLDGDGYADLVVGTGAREGDAVVVWGGKNGLSGGTPIPATNTQAGDFDGDGQLDLAVFRSGASPGDDPLGTTATVWTGPVTRSGKPSAKSPLDPGHLKNYDVQGGAVGDVNDDGRDDLALRMYCGEGSHCTAFYHASKGGLTPAGPEAVPSGSGDVALGDVNGDGYDDVLVADPGEGKIEVAPGSASGVRPRGTWKSYSQDTPGVPGDDADGYDSSTNVDRFATALAVGDITGDGIDDVAVGAPGEPRNGYNDVGVVDILRGSRSGLTGTGAQAVTEATPGMPGTAEAGDKFGSGLCLLDINRNGHADLAATAEGENSGDGRVYVLRGRPTGVVTDAVLEVDGRAVGAPYAKAAFGSAVR